MVAEESATQLGTPHSLEAEQSVLGAILLGNQTLNSIIPILQEQDFCRDSHRRIYRAILNLTEGSSAVDPVTLKDQLTKSGDLEAAGGLGYIASLLDGVPRLVNAEHHA